MIICGDRRNLQKDKHHCNTPPFWALWWCSQTQSSHQWRHMKTYLEFAKQHLKDPQTLRNKMIWSNEPQGTAHHLQSAIPKLKCAGSSLKLRGCFSAAGTETQSRVFRTSYWAEELPSNRTVTLSTQHEWLIDNSVNVLERPGNSLELYPIKYFWRNPEMCVCPIYRDRAWEGKRRGEEWQIIAKWWCAKLVASYRKKLRLWRCFRTWFYQVWHVPGSTSLLTPEQHCY